MKSSRLLFVFLALILMFGASAVSVSAQDENADPPTAEQDDDDDQYESPEAQRRLAEKAKIFKEQAKKIALERVPGTVLESEIDKENGVLVWEFEIKDAAGMVFEVLVNAETGEIVAVEEEGEEEDDDPPGRT